MKRQVALMLISLLGLCGAIVWFLQREQPVVAREGGGKGDRAEIDAMRDEVLRNRTELDQMRLELGRPRSDAPAATVAASEARAAQEEERSQNPEEMAALQQQEIAATAAQLEARVVAEQRDPEWSAPTEYAIAEVMKTDIAAGSRLVSAECRSDLCRVHIAHESATRRTELLNQLRFTAPFDTEGFVQTVGSAEAPESIVYIARSNTNLVEVN